MFAWANAGMISWRLKDNVFSAQSIVKHAFLIDPFVTVKADMVK